MHQRLLQAAGGCCSRVQTGVHGISGVLEATGIRLLQTAASLGRSNCLLGSLDGTSHGMRTKCALKSTEESRTTAGVAQIRRAMQGCSWWLFRSSHMCRNIQRDIQRNIHIIFISHSPSPYLFGDASYFRILHSRALLWWLSAVFPLTGFP